GRRDPPVVVALAALQITGAVQRCEDLLAELGALGQDRLDRVRRGVREARQVVVTLDLEDVVQEEQNVVDRRLVGWHRGPLPFAISGLKRSDEAPSPRRSGDSS